MGVPNEVAVGVIHQLIDDSVFLSQVSSRVFKHCGIIKSFPNFLLWHLLCSLVIIKPLKRHIYKFWLTISCIFLKYEDHSSEK